MKHEMTTPLRLVRGSGPARSGTHEFWLERMTSVALVPLTIAFVVILVRLSRAAHARVVEAFASPLVAILMFFFVAVGVLHMRIGMQAIIEDYVHGEQSKLAAILANTFLSWFLGAICLYALLKLNFGW
jgi:succinate dehydrogenase / fumarate reductase membrane anchor subunit